MQFGAHYRALHCKLQKAALRRNSYSPKDKLYGQESKHANDTNVSAKNILK